MNIQARRRELNILASKGREDWFVLDDMRAALTRHLNAAIIECSAMARDLSGDVVDPDQLMTDLRHMFDPYGDHSHIQDLFSDTFHRAYSAVSDNRGEPLSARSDLLPSGVAKSAE